MKVTDWSFYPNFKRSEFACKYTGVCEMDIEFMNKLQLMRNLHGLPMRINSGYRHWKHPIERKKGHKNGEHVQGRCADISATSSEERFLLVRTAIQCGFPRIGIAKTFVHVGLGGPGLPPNVIWLY